MSFHYFRIENIRSYLIVFFITKYTCNPTTIHQIYYIRTQVLSSLNLIFESYWTNVNLYLDITYYFARDKKKINLISYFVKGYHTKICN